MTSATKSPAIPVKTYTHGVDRLPLWVMDHTTINDRRSFRKGDRVLVYDDQNSMIVRAESPT